MRRLVPLALLISLIAPVAGARETNSSSTQIQALLDGGQIDAALEQLDRRLRKNPADFEALFLRSTASIMAGDLAAGRRDLEACVEVDPENRQAWLNLAALDLAENDYGRAIAAFLEAEKLDPDAPDNSLNIGAALLLAGDREQASQRFRRYLARHADNADAYYLVAANYAMAERQDLVVPLLSRAIQLNEKTRLRARTDANFAILADDPDFRQLLDTDSYVPPPEAPTASRSYDIPFTGRSSRVLDATLTALQRTGSPISAGVEVTPAWALIWSDVRIKVAANEAEGTDVILTAEPGSFTPAAWTAKTEALFRRITLELGARRPAGDR